MTARLAVLGSLNMDLVVRAPRIPAPGETIIGHDLRSVPGGKGANQAVAAARLGAQVSMIGRVGADAHGDALLSNLDGAAVDAAFVIRDRQVPSGVALIVVDEEGQNSIVVAQGANGRVSPADVDAAEAVIAGADGLILQLETPIDAVSRAARIARDNGVKAILNPAPARPLSSSLLACVDILIPNESETALLTGRPVETREDLEAAAAGLHALGVETVVLTLGPRGALLSHAGEMQRVPAFEVKVVDTTAAGDAFVAGFTVALSEGKAPREAVRWGNAAGALAATRLGAQSSLPARHDVEGLLQLCDPAAQY
jgi:ribokinase